MCDFRGWQSRLVVIAGLLLTVVPSHLRAADEPLIPQAINERLPKIAAGMKYPEIEKVFSPAYPKAKARLGLWSGQTGYIDVQLDERYSLSIAGINGPNGEPVVHKDILIYVYDQGQKRRVEIRMYGWENVLEQRAAEKEKKK